MDFAGAPSPPLFQQLMGDIRWRIFGEGEIDGESGARLEHFLIENGVPIASVIHLHSSGGSLEGGLSLGRVIRAHRLQAYVGKRGVWEEDGFWAVVPGHCMSAAALAFLGGEYRFVGEQSKYGVHRFTLGPDEVDREGRAQIQSASVMEFIHSMEVDTELFTLASETPPDDILVLPQETLVRLNIVNNGRRRPRWTIESIPSGLYLKGEQHTMYGMNIFMILFPADGDIGLHIIFDGGPNAEDAMRMGADRLAIDDEYIPMHERRRERVNENSVINATYRLDGELIRKLEGAKKVGMIFQWSEDSAIFLGFDSMPFEEGAAKLPGLLAIYRRR